MIFPLLCTTKICTMIKSMTGYGKATCEIDNKLLTVEVRSVNSKQFDLNLRIPPQYKDKENELRSETAKLFERGKLDISLCFENNGQAKSPEMNRSLVKSYYADLKSLADEMNAPSDNLLDTVMKMPDVFKTEKTAVTDEEWAKVKATILEAGVAFNSFRISEGKSLQDELAARMDLLLNLLTKIEVLEP